ncbi:MAG: hypothetical protein GWM90_01900 [Gemmatimonadetes bacterium]|nr:hypothetical protein [Gemmatimonadota bacterium]NIQ52359.1 hypothetical protein [Gemmatimonadota bacterium]NIX42924.1 hypothetical protein [Gemmatimonadota bacterium]NIY07099.1 hypothetical protein [Gemmatimonadota bacterium]
MNGMGYEREITVRTVDLMESSLSAKGASYEKLMVAKLGHDAADILARATR